MSLKLQFRIISVGLLVTLTVMVPIIFASAGNINSQSQTKEQPDGDVVVCVQDIDKTRYVTAEILIDAAPDKVWPIIVNPFEFKGKIAPRMKTVEVVTDQRNRSVLRFTIDAILIPHFTYTVESLYENGQRIQFHALGGMLKDLRGSWVITPVAGGSKTKLTYCMYMDPGLPVPKWMIREALKRELPSTLLALRKRIQNISQKKDGIEEHTILAASILNRKLENPIPFEKPDTQKSN